MSALQAYSEYRDSGVDSIGAIPSGWKVCCLKHMASIQNGADYKHVEAERGYPVMGSGGRFTFASEFMYDKPSVLLGRKGTIDRPLFINEPFWSVDTMYYTEIFANIPPRYLYYCALTIQFNKYTTNTALPSMTQESLGNYSFPSPKTCSERLQIANFLDYETAKIDTLIEKQQQLIKLLKEKRQAVISHAVTKGLNQDAPMKDSGVEWLGEVPEGWDVMQIRRLMLLMEQGKSPDCENREAEKSEWGVLKTSCVNNAHFDSAANKALPKNVKPFPRYEVKVGDVLMSRASGSSKLIGSVAYVYETRNKLLLSDKVFRLHLSSSVNRVYFMYVMQATYMRSNIESTISGGEGMASNITKSSILSYAIALPDIVEQDKIVDHVDRLLTSTDGLVSKAYSAIVLMKERRTALISAAVTGKIDVRNWQPPKATSTPSTDA